MKILLLGGTGTIGIHLSEILSQTGHDICITSRKPHVDKGNIHYICGNAKSIDFLSDIIHLKCWDVVVDFMCYSTEEFKERLCILLSNTKQYVFLSSSRVYAEGKDRLTEKSPRLLEESQDTVYLKTDEYALYKAREEDVLFSSGFSNYTILRPYITYGDNRLPLGIWEKETWLKRALSGKNIAMPRLFLNKETSLAYGQDASTIIAKLIGNPLAIGQIYNIVSNKSQSWKSIAHFYIDEINRIKGSKVQLIEFGQCCYSIRQILRCVLYKFHIIKSNYGAYSWNNYQLIYDREYNRVFDDTKTKSLANDFIFTDNDLGLQKCIRHFISSPHYDYVNYEWEMVQDRITGDVTPLSYFPGISYKLKYILIRYLIPRTFVYSK